MPVGTQPDRALPRRFVDAAIRRIGNPNSPEVLYAKRWDRLIAIRSCHLCKRNVGADSLCVALWPPSAAAEVSRFQLGRARLCQPCFTEHKPKVRVEARTWQSKPRPSEAGARALAAKPKHQPTWPGFTFTPKRKRDEEPLANW